MSASSHHQMPETGSLGPEDGRHDDATHDATPSTEPDSASSPLDAEREEPALVIEPLDAADSHRRRGVELRPLLNILSVALALLFVVIGAGAIHTLVGGTRPRAVGTVHLVISADSGGWNPAGTNASQDIAFAPSEPSIAYDCAAPDLSPSFTPVPIAVAVTRDTGRTWNALPTPGAGVTCSLTVNPTDARDVVLMVSPSSTFVSAPITLYRSGDGGQHWQRLSLPPRAGGQLKGAEYAWWAWSGGSLYLAPYFSGTSAYTDLAVSVNGGPFVWVQENGLFRGGAAGDSINLLLGTTNTLYVVLASPQTACITACTRLLASGNGGVSWSAYAPTFKGHSINVLWAGADGRTLFGSYFDDPGQAAGKYAYSPDGGANWRQVTPLPQRSIASSMLATPDGSFYAVLDTDPDSPPGTVLPGVYRLTPGATTWTFIAPPVDGIGGPIVVSWDSTGHPVALWGNIHASIADGIQPGLQRHPA